MVEMRWINSNIGCIETVMGLEMEDARRMINSNIGCIETSHHNNMY
ncbi:MAG: hypothetical protein RHS_4509 [Robinsoniella sp. RHS]|nr:MAG: hypothetical protein RHS_4509 [Robinsoniella sp. RHS]